MVLFQGVVKRVPHGRMSMYKFVVYGVCCYGVMILAILT